MFQSSSLAHLTRLSSFVPLPVVTATPTPVHVPTLTPKGPPPHTVTHWPQTATNGRYTKTLQQTATHASRPSVPTPNPNPPRHTLAIALSCAGAGLAATVTAGAVWWWRKRQATAESVPLVSVQ
eukprot:TRINITY_DN7315_c0_g1_i4.p1 TRINITY_DN7315_c0_g1~~TRINITY_DN7315_c0_g1_i4.p1  ORF type:complete len:124 (-),score=13.40 TRINITY_DN7315_c0_g1_i4:5-376(-)